MTVVAKVVMTSETRTMPTSIWAEGPLTLCQFSWFRKGPKVRWIAEIYPSLKKKKHFGHAF